MSSPLSFSRRQLYALPEGRPRNGWHSVPFQHVENVEDIDLTFATDTKDLLCLTQTLDLAFGKSSKVEAQTMVVVLPRNEVQIRAAKLSLADIRKIYDRLSRVVREQGAIEIATMGKREDQTDEQFEAVKSNILRDAFKVTVTVWGRNGETLYGDDIAIFESPILPSKIERFYATNVTAYRGVVNSAPVNSFELSLDFSKPPILDANSFVSSPTPNLSNLVVQGDRDGWVASATKAAMDVVNSKRTKRAWLHQAFAYDFGLLALGLPTAIYACWKMSGVINMRLGDVHSFVSGAAYVYVVFLTLFGFRALFGYAKAIFPTMELVDNQDTAVAHRAVLGAILLSLVGSFLFDIVK